MRWLILLICIVVFVSMASTQQQFSKGLMSDTNRALKQRANSSIWFGVPKGDTAFVQMWKDSSRFYHLSKFDSMMFNGVQRAGSTVFTDSSRSIIASGIYGSGLAVGGGWLQEKTNPVKTYGVESSIILNGSRADMWYRDDQPTYNDTIKYCYATDPYQTIWSTSVVVDSGGVALRGNCPYVVKSGSTYYMFLLQSNNIYLYSSTDKLNFSIMNSGSPVLASGTTSGTTYVYNCAVAIVSSTWHMLVEAQAGGGGNFNIFYTYSNLDTLNWATHLSSSPVISNAGNPELKYLPDRSAFLVLYGDISGSNWFIDGRYALIPSNLASAASWKSAPRFPILFKSGVDVTDPCLVETPGERHKLLLSYNYLQASLNQCYSNLTLDQFYDLVTTSSTAFTGGLYTTDMIQANELFITGKTKLTGANAFGPITTSDVLTINSASSFESMVLDDVSTNATNKTAGILFKPYTNANKSTGALLGFSNSTDNYVDIGGGQAAINAATDLRFWAAANNNTAIGTKLAEMKSTLVEFYVPVTVDQVSNLAKLNLTTGDPFNDLTISDVTTDATNKQSGLVMRAYTTANPKVGMILGVSNVTDHYIDIGGGHPQINTATHIRMYAAANNNTPTGTQLADFTTSSAAFSVPITSTAQLTLTTGSPFNDIVLRDVSTDATNKKAGIVATPYTNANQAYGLILGFANSSNNYTDIGGGQSLVNAATHVRIFAAANNNTASGTQQVDITDGLATFSTTVNANAYQTATVTGYLFGTSSKSASDFLPSSGAGDIYTHNASEFSPIAGSSSIVTLGTIANGLVTGTPNGGTSGTWKLGIQVSGTSVFDTTGYIQLDINGVLYKLALCQ